MTAPEVSRRRPAAVRLAGIGLLAVAVTGALYAAGRLLSPNYGTSLFGQTGLAAVSLKSLLASVVLGLAAMQVCWPCGCTASCRWQAARHGRSASPTGSPAWSCSR